MATDVLGWTGFGALTPYVPLPNLPMPAPIDALWLGVRDVARRLGHPVQVAGSVGIGGVPANTVVTADGTRAVVVTQTDNWDSGVHTARVAVLNPATGAQVGKTIVLTGASTNPPVVSADGTRAVITTVDYNSTDATRVTVIDLADGTQVGTTVALYGRPISTPVLSADGSRALVTSSDGNTNGNAWLSVIDTATGAHMGASLHFSSAPVALSADGKRAVIATSDVDDATTTVTTHLAVFDTDTGDQLGTTITLSRSGDQWSAGTQVVRTDDTHVLAVAYGPTATQVAVLDTATGAQVGTTVTLTDPNGVNSPTITVDHGNAVIAMSSTDPVTSHMSTSVVVIDTASGALAGATPVQLPGRFSAILFSATGAQALLITDEFNTLIPGDEPSHASVIDTATGAQIGSTIDLDGQPWNASGAALAPVLSADGTHALVTVGDSGGTTHLVVVDTTSGEQAGVVVSLPGRPAASVPITVDGSRAVVTTIDGDDIYGYTTHVSVVDTATGDQIGTTVSVRGDGSGPALLAADGSRAVILTSVYSYATGLSSTRLAVIDTTTGKQVGGTRTLGGYATLAQVLGTDRTHALVATSAWNPVTSTASAHVLLIDTVTGHKLGGLTLAGDPWQPWVSADGTRALFANQVSYLWHLGADTTGVTVLQIA